MVCFAENVLGTTRDIMISQRNLLLLLGFCLTALTFTLFHMSTTSEIRDGSTLQLARWTGTGKLENTLETNRTVEQSFVGNGNTIMMPIRHENQVSVQSTEPLSSHTLPNVLNDFGLYLRMYHGKREEYFSMLVPSMKYFWFLPVNLTVVLDDTPEDREFGKEIASKFPFPTICYDRKFDPKIYDNDGYKLQQLSMFYAEECFDQKYVGFIDTDTFFVTSTTPELMFNRTKPLVIGRYGQHKKYKNWWIGTQMALGKKEVFTCMNYFPVVMKVEHIIQMRRYVANLHRTDFLNVFWNFSQGQHSFSQFSIMCNYVWYFQREEYQFHAQLRDDVKWNVRAIHPSRQPKEYYDAHLTKEMLYPVPRSSIHFRYHPGHKDPNAIQKFIKIGACFSGGFQWCPEQCGPAKQFTLHGELFRFEFLNWMWDKHCGEVQRQHYMNVRTNYSEAVKPQILLWCQDVGKL